MSEIVTPEHKVNAFIRLGICFQFVVAFCFCFLEEMLYFLKLRTDLRCKEKNREGYVPLFNFFDHYFVNNVVRIGVDMYNNVIGSMAGGTACLLERISDNRNVTFRFTGNQKTVINMASYNYLGLNQNSGRAIEEAERTIVEFGLGISSTRLEFGTTPLHQEVEREMARFLNVEDSIVFGMGFATNSTNIPALFDDKTLIVSDEHSHASTALGCKLINGTVLKFKHNDMNSLEERLQYGLLVKQRKGSKIYWKRIVIFVEGIYSMEGTIVNLPEVLRLKKKYKAYLYLDEAHSLGAIGKTGRGVTEYFGINPNEIDVMMGTFTKSFAAAGGYVAGKKSLVNYLRVRSHSNAYATSISLPILQQVLQCLRVMTTPKIGESLAQTLASNTSYFRTRLQAFNFKILGPESSPAVPVIIRLPIKLRYFVVELQRRGVATAATGPPAVPLTSLRARFCLSAAHTKEMLDEALDIIHAVALKAKIV